MNKRYLTYFMILMTALFLIAPHSANARKPGQKKRRQNILKVPPYIPLARQALASGDIAAVVDLLRKAKECWSEHSVECGFTQREYLSILGILLLQQGEPDRAIQALRGATSGEDAQPGDYFYLGQALMQTEDYSEAVKALRAGKSAGVEMAAYFAMLSRAEKTLEHFEEARKTLAEGLSLFDENALILRELTLLYADLGLSRSALDFGMRYMKASKNRDPLAMLLLAESLRQKGAWDEAIAILETAHLADPDSQTILERLAYTWAESGAPMAAAPLFENRSWADSGFAHWAADHYRQAGRFEQALRISYTIPDVRRRTQVQAAIYIERGDLELAIMLLNQQRKKGQADTNALYQLAHLAIQSERIELAREVLFPSIEATSAPHFDELRQSLSGF
ncbi:hypothetical protein KAI87_01220 [Myxococcota bacterium]|nr:hypothetical protein [Myxococcota bacterium]